MHTDALGSVDTITNESGVVIQRLAYDTFGKRIVLDWINANYTPGVRNPLLWYN